MEKVKWRPNIVDFIIIVAVVAVLGVFFMVIRGTGDGGGILSPGTQQTVYYWIELHAMRGESAERIQQGDALIDRVENRPLGTVVDVYLRPAERAQNNFITGDRIITTIPDRTDAIIRVRAVATITEHQIAIGRFTLRAGTRVSLVGPLYHGSGFVVDIERGDEW